MKIIVLLFLLFCLMVFNATFNNISVISWQSVLLVEETIHYTCAIFILQGPSSSWLYGSFIYNYLCNQCPNPVHGEVYLIQHYVINFVSDLQHVDGFLQVLWFPPPIKLTATIYCWKWGCGVINEIQVR
jgi:hypothetical protein